MKESVTIRNFGPIREACIEDLRPLTILIGESGSGKRTFLQKAYAPAYQTTWKEQYSMRVEEVDLDTFELRDKAVTIR